jgi:hypothetical protein
MLAVADRRSSSTLNHRDSLAWRAASRLDCPVQAARQHRLAAPFLESLDGFQPASTDHEPRNGATASGPASFVRSRRRAGVRRSGAREVIQIPRGTLLQHEQARKRIAKEFVFQSEKSFRR